MQENNNISEELKAISPLLGSIKRNCPYAEPAGYFDSLVDDILANIKLSTLANNSNIYSLPDGYFENFADSVFQRIKLEETKVSDVHKELYEVAPLLNNISKRNIYSLPENYFDGFSIEMQILQEPAKVISLAAKFKKALHYAVAASVLFVIASTSFLYVHQHSKNINKSLSIEQRLATLNDDDIINYLKYDHQADDISPASNAQDTQLQNLLMNASDEEIERYLDEDNSNNEKNVKGI